MRLFVDPSMRVAPVRLSDLSEGAVRADFTGTVPGWIIGLKNVEKTEVHL